MSGRISRSSKTLAQLSAAAGLPIVSSGNVNQDSISPFLGLKYKTNSPTPPEHVIDPIPQSMFDQNYTDFTYPIQSYTSIIDPVLNCDTTQLPNGSWVCKDWENDPTIKNSVHDKYRESVFPSEFKYLSDWNDSQWGAYLVFIYDRDVESTLKFLEAVDNDVQQHIYATPIWDNAWKQTTKSIGTVDDKYTPLTRDDTPAGNDSWRQLPNLAVDGQLPNNDHRHNWRKIYRYVQKDNRSTWRPPGFTGAASTVLGDKYITDVTEGYQNVSYNGSTNGNWGDTQPYGPTLANLAKMRDFKSTATFNNSVNPKKADTFTGSNFYGFQDLNNSPGKARSLPEDGNLRSKATFFRTNGTWTRNGYKGVGELNEEDMAEKIDDAKQRELCRLHIFDRYAQVNDIDFKLDHYGISKQIWTQIIMDGVKGKRKEAMLKTAYGNLVGRFQEDQTYAKCSSSFLSKHLGNKGLSVLSLVGTLIKIASVFVRIHKMIDQIDDYLTDSALDEAGPDPNHASQQQQMKKKSASLSKKSTLVKEQVALAKNPGMSNTELNNTSKALTNLLPDNTSNQGDISGIHLYYRDLLNPAMNP